MQRYITLIGFAIIYIVFCLLSLFIAFFIEELIMSIISICTSIFFIAGSVIMLGTYYSERKQEKLKAIEEDIRDIIE